MFIKLKDVGWRNGVAVMVLALAVLVALPAMASAQVEKSVSPTHGDGGPKIKGLIATNGVTGVIPDDGSNHGQWSVRYKY